MLEPHAGWVEGQAAYEEEHAQSRALHVCPIEARFAIADASTARRPPEGGKHGINEDSAR